MKTMFVFNSFRLDVANATLSRGKQAIFLTPKAFNVLRYLVEHSGQLVTKDDLWRAVWPEISVTDATLTMFVSKIRKALGDDPKTPRYIETVHRLGYRFIAPVSIDSVPTANARIQPHDSAFVPATRSASPYFVGREVESAQLQKWLEQAAAGERQVVFVTGEPGIGKTTLIEEFLRQAHAAANGRLWIGRGQCIEHYGAGEAYLPLLDALGRLCREPGGGRLRELLDKHAPAWLAQMPALLNTAEWKELQGRVAGATRERMLRELAEAMEVITAEKPLVLRLEDLHWSDYSTVEWLGFLARRQEPARLLVLATYRPVEVIVREHPLRNLKHELQIHSQCQELSLALLTEAAVTEYLTRRFASLVESNTSITQPRAQSVATERLGDLARTIYRRTDGNPLFMVNVVEYLVEHEILKTFGGAGAAQTGTAPRADSINTPSNIVEMIEHNLDRLNPDERRLLEAASVAGAEFSAASIAAALGGSVDESEACCARLSRRQQFLMTLDTHEWPDGTTASSFRFQHSLYGEVLYQRLSAGHRVQLHRRIAERLEIAWGERAEEIAVELAHHYTEAGFIQRAIPYWQKAGRRAVKRSANAEAISHFTRALQLLKFTPDSPERIQQELRLQMALGGSLMAIKGNAIPEAGKAYARAVDLSRQTDEPSLLFPALGALSGFYLVQGELWTAHELIEQYLSLAQKPQTPARLQAAHYMMGVALYYLGELSRSRTHLEQAIALYDPRKERFRAIEDPGVACLAVAARTLWALGYPDQALERIRESLTLAQELSHPFSLAFALYCAAELYQFRREVAASEEQAEALIALAHEQEFTLREATGIAIRGWVLAKQGQQKEGISKIRQGLATIQATGAAGLYSNFFVLLAEACGEAGQTQEGLRALTEAFDLVSRTGWAAREPELYRLKGELLLMQTNADTVQIESCFQHAIEVARKQSAKSWELRATMSLARLLRDTGRRDKAHTMLAEIYNWFTEGFDTADLKDAKALLEELAT
jgi:predicted ATPase/DNA-binding winged helix-turn-helix (wHTH) protein